ncbi:MAG: TolC family protein [Aliarcobacter sp.]|nr:TolC family protein [Aliarcobacter sp.]
MLYRNIISSIFCSFILIACVPKFDKIDKTDETKIINELNSLKLTDNKNELTTKWWELFNDEQLNSIITKALNESASLKSLEQRYEKANSIIKAVESENLPNISFESSITRERFSLNHIFPAPLGGGIFTGYHSATTLDYKFDFWNERKSRIKSAKNRAIAELALIEESRLNLALGITQLYLSWSFNEKKVEEFENIVHILNSELDIMKQRYESGLIDEVSLNNKKAQIFQVKNNIYSIQEIIKGQKASMCILGGFLPSYAENMNKPKISNTINLTLAKELPLNLLSQRADVSIQKYIVLSNEQNINIASAKFYPNINLSSLLGFTSFDSSKFLTKSSTVPSLGVALDLPIFDWGKREANLDEKVIDYNSSVYEYNDIVNKAANEVIGVLKKIEYKNLQLDMHEKELKTKKTNEHIENRKFEIGLNDKVPYFDSQINTLMNEILGLDLIESHTKLQLELIKALGGGFKEEDIKNGRS